jgi:hypothetical protein
MNIEHVESNASAFSWSASTSTTKYGTRYYYQGSDEDEAREMVNLLLMAVIESEGSTTVLLIRRETGQPIEIMEAYVVAAGKIIREEGKLIEGEEYLRG